MKFAVILLAAVAAVTAAPATTRSTLAERAPEAKPFFFKELWNAKIDFKQGGIDLGHKILDKIDDKLEHLKFDTDKYKPKPPKGGYEPPKGDYEPPKGDYEPAKPPPKPTNPPKPNPPKPEPPKPEPPKGDYY